MSYADKLVRMKKDIARCIFKDTYLRVADEGINVCIYHLPEYKREMYQCPKLGPLIEAEIVYSGQLFKGVFYRCLKK